MRVVVTRPRAQAGPLVERLEAAGHVVVECPLIEIAPLETGPVDASGYDWLVVTSPNAADLLAARMTGPLPRVAAIGPGTAEALGERGIRADLVPRVSTQEGLLDELPRSAGRVLFAGARHARRTLIDALGADVVELYDTVLLTPERAPDGDLVVLASGSAARSFAAVGSAIPVVSIGPQTTRAAEAAGLHVVAEAESHDLDGLVAAVDRAAALVR